MTKTCASCKSAFEARRSDAKACSARCRKRLQRAKQKRGAVSTVSLPAGRRGSGNSRETSRAELAQEVKFLSRRLARVSKYELRLSHLVASLGVALICVLGFAVSSWYNNHQRIAKLSSEQVSTQKTTAALAHEISLKLNTAAIQTGDLAVIGTVSARDFVGDGLGISNINASSILQGTILPSLIAPDSLSYNQVDLTNSITNADINTNARISDSKLATISTSGKIADSALSGNVALLAGNQTFTGFDTFSPSSTSTKAFQILSPNKVLLDVDTVNNRIGIGTNTPSSSLGVVSVFNTPPTGSNTGGINTFITSNQAGIVSQRYTAIIGKASDASTVANITISGVDTGNPVTITTATAHNFNSGDQIDIYGLAGGSCGLNNNEWVISNVTATTFQASYDNSGGTCSGTGTATNRPMLYGGAFTVSPQVARGGLQGTIQNGDDVNGLVVYNGGTAKATDAFYLGNNPAIVGNQWDTAFTVDANSNYGIRLNGTFSDTAIDLSAGTSSVAPIKLKNNTSIISKDAAGTGTVTLIGADTSNNVSLRSGAQTIDSNGSATFKPSSDSTAAFQVENSSATPQLVLDTTTDATNLVLNGNFETSTSLTNWTAKNGNGASSITRTSTARYLGSNSMQINTTGADSTDAGATYNLTLVPSTSYTFTIWTRLASGSMTDLKMGYSNDGTLAGESNTTCALGGATSVLTTGWNYHSCTFTTPASNSGTPYVYISQSTSANHLYYVDAVKVEQSSIKTPFKASGLTIVGDVTSPLILHNSEDSQAAFQVTKSSAASPVLTVDTQNSRVGIGIANPQQALDVWTSSGTSYQARLNSTGTATAGLIINSNTAGNLAVVKFQDASTDKWLVGKNTDNTFVIQDASSKNWVQIDSSGANLYLGNTGIASTIQIGNTTGAVAQTINIGNNSTASSSTAVVIGSVITGSTTTIQGANGINIGTSSAGPTVQIGNTANNVSQTINIGNNSTAGSTDTVTLGNQLGTSTTTIQGGTSAGAITLQTGNQGSVIIGEGSSNNAGFGITERYTSFVTPNASSTTFNPSTNIQTGKFAVMMVGTSAGITISSVTDSKGNTWHVDVSNTDVGGGRVSTIVSAPIGTSITTSDTITVNYSVSNPNNVQIWVEELSGVISSGAFDKSAVGSGVSSTETTAATSTLSQGAEVAIATTRGNLGGQTYTPGTGWTGAPTTTLGSSAGAEYKVTSSTTAVSGSMTSNGSPNWTMALATYRLNSNILTVNTAQTTYKPTTDQTTAFQIQNAAATLTLFNVDTAGNIVYIGTTGSTATASTVHIADTSGNASQTITIGSTSSASAVTIQAGTGRITFTGQIKVAQSGSALTNSSLTESGAGSATLCTGSVDTAGCFTTSTTSHTTIKLTFGATMTNAPFCTISAGNAAAATIMGSTTSAFVSTTATDMTITTAADTTAAKWYYHCFTF